MTYYQSDAETVDGLRTQIEALGMPLVIMRKFTSLINAIEVQVEDDYASGLVVATLFDALLQLAGEIREPESGTVVEYVEQCRDRISKRLAKRSTRTSAST